MLILIVFIFEQRDH